jgi:Flp pilus assembly protein TadG
MVQGRDSSLQNVHLQSRLTITMSIRALLRRFREQPRGQSFVEFALILPIFLVIMSAAIDLGRIAYARVTIANVAREASFQAAQTPTAYLAGQPCAAGNEGANMVICRAILESTGSVITVRPADIALTCTPTCAKAMGNTVTVNATGRFNLLTPVMAVFFGGTTITFSSTATNQISALPSLDGEAPPPPPPPGDVAVPPLIGETEDAALVLLATAGLTAGARIETYSSVIPVGSVVDQGPAAGTLVAAGSAVAYTVSLGPDPAPVCSLPSAGFTYTADSTLSPGTNLAPVKVSVTDTSTSSPSCPISTWKWDWDDGPATYGKVQLPHVYDHPPGVKGSVTTYHLTLTVTNAVGSRTSGTVEISVTKP